MNVCDIKNIESEAGIIASIIMNPEFTFYSEQLKPNHFSDTQNAYIYYAVRELAKRGIEKIDAYNITNVLNMKESTRKQTETITIGALNDLIDVAKIIARSSVEEYKLLVNNVLDAAFRRDTYNKLIECEKLCFNSTEKDIEQKIYSSLDSVMMEFSTTSEVPQYKDVVDQLWHEIEERQRPGSAGEIPFKFPTLNAYTMIERGELIVFGAEQKQGKSMLLLNCAVDLMKRGLKVLYLDSELNSRLFTCRLISHLTGIEFRRVRSGRYSEDEKRKIYEAIGWLKGQSFTHIYMPVFDEQSIYTTFKKVYHTQGVDVIIVDYFKSTSEGDAFSTYMSMGSIIDLLKNKICGESNVAGIGAAQATSSGKLADSAKIARNASTIVMLQDKTSEEIEADGEECGNKKLFVKFNRNGAQMCDGEYIDMKFNGDIISYEEAKQHIPAVPY